MPNLNSCHLIGTLTRDPEIKYTASGKAICQIGIAINESYKTAEGEKREEVTFLDVEFWGRIAEIVGEYCRKGSPLFIDGKLKLDTWDDKQTGQKRSKIKVVGQNIQLLGSKPDAPKQAAPPPKQRAQGLPQRPVPQKDPDLDAPHDQSEIPF